MERYFALDYSGTPFELFGPAHLATALVMAALGWAFIRVGERGGVRRRTFQRRALVAFLVANEIGWHAWNLHHGVWTATTMLPLHACAVMVWWTVWAMWNDHRGLYAPIYFLGIAGAIQAVITPDAGAYGFPHYRFFQTLGSHSALVVAGVWAARVDGFRPTWRSLLAVFGGLNAYALVVYFVNMAVGSNYLYVNGKPEVATLMDYMPPWPWYLLVLEGLAFGFYVVLWLPYRHGPYARSPSPGARSEPPGSR